MKGSLLATMLVILTASSLTLAQDNLDDELDLSELDEFGEEAKPSAPKDAPADAPEASGDEFDLDNPAQENAEGSADDLEKELEALDDEELPPENAKPAEKAAEDSLDELPELEAPPEEVAAPPAPAEPPPAVAPPSEETVPEAPPEPVAEAPAPVAEPVQPVVDVPNAELEARLDKIFQKFMSSPTTDEEWLQIAGEKSSEVYTVQTGDTLWDISVTFFGNGNFWPKVWQLNDDITNPHIIQPGRAIKFTPGTLSQAPTMQVTDAEAEVGAPPDQPELPQESEDVASNDEESEEVPVPAATPRPPVVNPIPNSLPMIITTKEGQFDRDGFAIDKQAVGELNPVMPIQSVLKAAPTPLGEVVGIELDRAETAALYQNVYVQAPGANKGDLFSVYDLGPEVKYESEEYGRIVAYTGRIQIIEQVEGELPDLYKAMVTQSYDHVRIGGKLTREEIPTLQIAEGGNLKSASGEVIGGPGRTDRKLFSEKSVAFLNVGSDQGVQPGDLLNIVRNELRRGAKGIVTKSTAVIGQIKLGQVAEKTSTGIVLNSKEAIQVGDFIATGIVTSSSPTGAPGSLPTELEDLGEEEAEMPPADSLEGEVEDLE